MRNGVIIQKFTEMLIINCLPNNLLKYRFLIWNLGIFLRIVSIDLTAVIRTGKARYLNFFKIFILIFKIEIKINLHFSKNVIQKYSIIKSGINIKNSLI